MANKHQDLEKHTIRLRPGDMDRIRERFPRLGANPVIRKVISNFVDAVDPETWDEDTIEKLIEAVENEQ